MGNENQWKPGSAGWHNQNAVDANLQARAKEERFMANLYGSSQGFDYRVPPSAYQPNEQAEEKL